MNVMLEISHAREHDTRKGTARVNEHENGALGFAPMTPKLSGKVPKVARTLDDQAYRM